MSKLFQIDTDKLVTGCYMFRAVNSNLQKISSTLKKWSGSMNSLYNGWEMFYNCTALQSFYGKLSSLTEADYMFSGCNLDTASVRHIWETLPQNTSTKSITIGVGIETSGDSNRHNTFAQSAGWNNWNELKQAFVSKKWSVTWLYSHGQGNITLSEDERFRGIPVYAKLIEIEPQGVKLDEEGNQVGEKFYTDEQKQKAEYCTEDGTQYYNILWGHDVTHPEEFEYFGSLLEACGYYGVIPKQYLEEI